MKEPNNDLIKQAFYDVKEDVIILRHEITNIKKVISEIKEELRDYKISSRTFAGISIVLQSRLTEIDKKLQAKTNRGRKKSKTGNRTGRRR